jgi:hypothetical protein
VENREHHQKLSEMEADRGGRAWSRHGGTYLKSQLLKRWRQNDYKVEVPSQNK